jgi:hypothetical protein
VKSETDCNVGKEAAMQEVHCQCAQAPDDLKLLLSRGEVSHGAPNGRHPRKPSAIGVRPNSSAAAALAGLSDEALILVPTECCQDRQAVAVTAVCTSQPMLAVAYQQRASQHVCDGAVEILQCAVNGAWENRLKRMGLIAVWDTSNPSKRSDVFCTAGSDVSCLASGPPCAANLLLAGCQDGCSLCWDLSGLSSPTSQVNLFGRACTLLDPSACAPSSSLSYSDEIDGPLNKNPASPIVSIRTMEEAESRHDGKCAFHLVSLCELGTVDLWSVLSTSGEELQNLSGFLAVDSARGLHPLGLNLV